MDSHYEIYDFDTNLVLGYETVPARKINAFGKFYDEMKAKYGDRMVMRPHVEPAKFGYRNVKIDDLKPGLIATMVVDPHEATANGYLDCTVIRVDRLSEEKIFNKKIPYIFYHCISPRWEGQCFTPISDFLNLPFSKCGGPETRYWIYLPGYPNHQ